MTEAILRLSSAGGEELARVLGQARSAYRSLGREVSATAQKMRRDLIALAAAHDHSNSKMLAAEVRALAARTMAHRTYTRVIAEQEGQRLRIALRAIAAQNRAQGKIREVIQSTQRAATRVVKEESIKRAYDAEWEAKSVQKVTLALLVARENAERRLTQTTQQEAQRRQQIHAHERPPRPPTPGQPGGSGGSGGRGSGRNGVGPTIGRVIVGGVRAASEGFSGSLQQVQSAEERRAGAEYTLNGALLQTGAAPAEIERLRRSVFEYGGQHGLRTDVLASALAEGQGRFGGLAGNTEAERADALRQSLDAAQFARNAHADIGQVVSFNAMLRQQGVIGPMRNELLRNFTGIAYGGSVEVGDALSQALPSLLQSVNAATAAHPGTNRDQLIQETLTNFFAMMQLEGAGGMGTGTAGSRLMTMQTMLSSDRTQDRLGGRLYERFQNDRNARPVLDRMFQTDRQGRRHLREEYRDPARFAEQIDTLFGGDPTAVRNFMRNAGHSGGQLINRPETAALVGMLNNVVDPNTGQTVKAYQRVQTLRRETLTPAQLQTAEAVTASEIDTKLVGRQEREANNLLGSNTDALREMNTTLQEFRSNHPLLAGLAGKVGGDSSEYGVGKFLQEAGADRPYSDEVQREAYRMFMSKDVGDSRSQDTFAEQLTSGRVRNANKVSSATKDADPRAYLQMTIDAFRHALEQAHLTATVSPVDAAHAASVAGTRNQGSRQ